MPQDPGKPFAIDVDAAEALAIADSASSKEVAAAVVEAAGEGVRAATIRHFREREREPRKSEGFPAFGQEYPKRHFWAGTRGNSVAEAVGKGERRGDELTISINSPALAHKANPNPPEIRPKGGRRLLAIPANARAAGFDGPARDFMSGNLGFGFAKTPDGRLLPALVAKNHYLRRVSKGARAGELAVAKASQRATEGAGDAQFWLVRKVRTPHDPKALPDEGALAEEAKTAAEAALRSFAGKGTAP